jgi:hypothetical protein
MSESTERPVSTRCEVDKMNVGVKKTLSHRIPPGVIEDAIHQQASD